MTPVLVAEISIPILVLERQSLVPNDLVDTYGPREQ
jgi:hypothetical protein